VLRADYSYRSKVYFDAVNTESVAQDGYGMVNLRAAFDSAGGRWSIAAGVTNATDETYIVMGVGVLESLGFASAIYGRPREWFLQGSYHF
jgi:iron complex outermembrane receptor protein